MDAAREYCLGLPQVTEDTPFGPEVVAFRIAGKIFALLALDGPPWTINLKAEPEQILEWRATYESVQPGYHMNKTHWNTVGLQGDVPASVLREMMARSYDVVRASLPAKVRKSLETV